MRKQRTEHIRKRTEDRGQRTESKKHILFAFILLWLALLPGVCLGAEYYVRSETEGNNDGSDWTNAWTELPATLVRGDTYYIADGTYGVYVFDDPEDGEKYIYIKKAIESDHGTNTGWQSSYGDGQAVFINPGKGNRQVWKFLSGYDIMDGQVGGGPGDWDGKADGKPGCGFKITGPADKDWSIEQYYIQLGNFFDDSQNPDYSEFHHIEVTADDYFDFPPTPDNIFQGMGLVQNIKAENEVVGGNGPLGIKISHCYFHDNGFHLFLDSIRNATIEYNYFKQNWSSDGGSPHQENGLKIYGAHGVIIRYNLWEDNSGSGTLWFAPGSQTGLSADVIVEDVYIYGNVFYYSDENQFGNTGGTIPIASDARDDDLVDNFNVYNNTFVNLNSSANNGVRASDGIATVTNFRVYNNLFYDIDSAARKENFFQNVTSRGYNWFYDSVLGGENEDTWLAEGETSGQLGTGVPFVDWQNRDFRLKEATAPGVYFDWMDNRDMFGNTRGADGNWDRGAIEYVATSILYGDINGNGEVTAYDAALVARYAVGLESFTDEQRQRADVSGNGAVSAYDAALIAQKAVGLIDRFPVEE